MTLFKRFFLNKNFQKSKNEEQLSIFYNQKESNLQRSNLDSNSTNNYLDFNNCSNANYEEQIYEFISEAHDFNLKNFYQKYKSEFTPEIKEYFISNLLMFKKKAQNIEIRSKKDFNFFGLSIEDISLNFNLNDKVKQHLSNNINCFYNKINKHIKNNQTSNFSKAESFSDIKRKMIQFLNLNKDNVNLRNDLKSKDSAFDETKKLIFKNTNLIEEMIKNPFFNKINNNKLFTIKKNYNNCIKNNNNQDKNKTKNIFIIKKLPKISPIKIKNFFNDYPEKQRRQIMNISMKKEHSLFLNNINKKTNSNNNIKVLNLTENNISILSQLSKYSCSTKSSENNNNLHTANLNQKEKDSLECKFINFEKNLGFNCLHSKKLDFNCEQNEKAKRKEKSDSNFKPCVSLSDMKNSFLFNAEAFFKESNQYSCKFANKKNTENEVRVEKKNITSNPSLFDNLNMLFNKQKEFDKSNFVIKDSKNVILNEAYCLNFNNNNNNTIVNINNKSNFKNISNNDLENSINPNQDSFLSKKRKIEVLYNNNEKSNLINNEKVSSFYDMTKEEKRNLNEICSDTRFNNQAKFKENMLISYNHPIVFNKNLDIRHFYDNFINNMQLLKKNLQVLINELNFFRKFVDLFYK